MILCWSASSLAHASVLLDGSTRESLFLPRAKYLATPLHAYISPIDVSCWSRASPPCYLRLGARGQAPWRSAGPPLAWRCSTPPPVQLSRPPPSAAAAARSALPSPPHPPPRRRGSWPLPRRGSRRTPRRPRLPPAPSRHTSTASATSVTSRGIDTYYMSSHCTICGDMIQGSDTFCNNCLKNEVVVATVVAGRTSKLEREIQHLAAICDHCGGADWIVESGVKCISLACRVFYERRKIQRELKVVSESAGEAGYYPFCCSELF